MGILHTASDDAEAPEALGVEPQKGLSDGAPGSSLVRDAPIRTACPSGLSHLELPWLTEGMTYLQRQGSGVFVTVQAYGRPERIVRDLARKAKAHLTTYQARAGMKRRLWLEVLESKPEVHTHIVAPFPSLAAAAKAIETLNGSSLFLSYGANTLMAVPVTAWNKLTKYLAGEATPQAWFAAGRSFTRVKGSHPLGEGGGDRVRVSRDLDAALVRSGNIEPRKRSYALRSLPKPPKTIQAGETQLSLFPHLDKPISRLKDFNAGVAPAAVRAEIRFRLRRRGWTQDELARRTNMSRPQITNFLQGRFGTTNWHVQRIREALGRGPPVQ